MAQSVHITFKKFKKAALSLMAFLLLHSAFAQSVPELVFRNPVLEQGVAGQDDAVYRFYNIRNGIDGLLKIKKRSNAAVELEDIDVADIGWDNALQPRLGISGRTQEQSWWMQFELTFVQSHSTRQVTLEHFVATPIDVDGDNVAVREFLQMNETKDIAYSSLTCLKTGTALPEPIISALNNGGDDHNFNTSGTGNIVVGPVTSFADMDTAATAVMATYTYENKNAITFIMGVTSDGAAGNAGMAGLRLHSLWFKNFSLAPQKTRSVNLETFSAIYAGKVIKLNWKTASEQGFSHFVIERSVDGRTYSDIALIRATGSEGKSTYSYKDKPVLMSAGIAYYRLRIIDAHRLASYSSVSAVYAKDGKNATKVAVFSNPVEGNISIGLLGKTKQ